MSKVVVPLALPSREGRQALLVREGQTSQSIDYENLTETQKQSLITHRKEVEAAKVKLLRQNEELQSKREHYPHTKAPKELLRSKYLSPYIPETTDEEFYTSALLNITNPELASRKRLQRWNPYRSNVPLALSSSRHSREGGNPGNTWGLNGTKALFPADETTNYTYDRANRLTDVDLPNGTDVEFTYDGMGRRLTKTVTETSGTDTLETTYKYHYLGGQITTIDIDQTTTDDSEPPVTTSTKDETIHIHLGPNSQPISFEWVRYDYQTSTTLDNTYYYHYDIHGNVIKITDEDSDEVCFYEYDVLGNITTESNPDSIPNFFKLRGAAQVLWDDELDTSGLYFLSTYNASNPSSSAMISGMAHSFRASSQTGQHVSLAKVHSHIEAKSAPSSGACEHNSITPKQSEPTFTDSPPPSMVYTGKIYTLENTPERWGPATRYMDGKGNSWIEIGLPGLIDDSLPTTGMRKIPVDYYLLPSSMLKKFDPRYNSNRRSSSSASWNEIPKEIREKILEEEGIDSDGNGNVRGQLEGESIDDYECLVARFEALKESLEFVSWGIENDTGEYWLLGYKQKGRAPKFFWGPNRPDDKAHRDAGQIPGYRLSGGGNACFVKSWSNCTLSSVNFTGERIYIRWISAVEDIKLRDRKIFEVTMTISASGGEPTLRTFERILLNYNTKYKNPDSYDNPSNYNCYGEAGDCVVGFGRIGGEMRVESYFIYKIEGKIGGISVGYAMGYLKGVFMLGGPNDGPWTDLFKNRNMIFGP